MQTFLPYPNFNKSVQCLDMRRLGKQRVEAFQILNILLDRHNLKKRQNHPAVKMWKGYEELLKVYFNCCVIEWVWRGYKNSMEEEKIDWDKVKHPDWFDNKEFHASHRSNLLRKNPEYYSKFGWKEPNNLPYIWPTK